MATTFDTHANLSSSTVATVPTPAASGTTLILVDGSSFPSPTTPYNCTVWPANAVPTPTNSEIVRVTAKSTNTFTITRIQEGSSARAITVGDNFALTITKKALTDIEALLAPFPASGTSGGILGYTGTSTLASSVLLTNHGVVLGQGAGATPVATAAMTTGQVLAGSTGADPIPTAATSLGVRQLLKQGSGTSTAAGATNVDTFALSGLLTTDILKIIVVMESVTQNTAVPMLYSVTDSAQVAYLSGNATLTAGMTQYQEASLACRQGSSLNVINYTDGGTGANGGLAVSGGFTLTTAWTAPWTIALRHGGVTAGGTFKYQWWVYKEVGA